MYLVELQHWWTKLGVSEGEADRVQGTGEPPPRINSISSCNLCDTSDQPNPSECFLFLTTPSCPHPESGAPCGCTGLIR